MHSNLELPSYHALKLMGRQSTILIKLHLNNIMRGMHGHLHVLIQNNWQQSNKRIFSYYNSTNALRTSLQNNVILSRQSSLLCRQSLLMRMNRIVCDQLQKMCCAGYDSNTHAVMRINSRCATETYVIMMVNKKVNDFNNWWALFWKPYTDSCLGGCNMSKWIQIWVMHTQEFETLRL